jgi:hypothetical protein
MFINVKAVYHLPLSMADFIGDSTFFGLHASDADFRKGSDTSESPKHFLDIEDYPVYTGLTQNLDSLIALYGWTTVKDIGILPWATLWAYDSLVAQIRRGATARAESTAADLGHYVGDGHQPLHITVNYDGQMSGNNGIHSRYETTMIDTYRSQLKITPAMSLYIGNRFSYIMDYLLQSRVYVDSILQADTYAKATSGWNGSGQAPAMYYSALWDRCGPFTLKLLQSASEHLASLWYSAHVDAGVLTTRIASFTGKSLGTNHILLTWSTLGEVNNFGFDVQRSSAKDSGFRTITGHTIPGGGTTNEQRDYSFTDDSAGSGGWYYRLKQIDLDGAMHFTEAIRVEGPASVAGVSPQRFALFQNYPNPFNPRTEIAYQVPGLRDVRLIVFDLRGREVATLVNERQPAGQYSVVFDATGLPSGAYFYRLTAGEFELTRKLIVLR